MISGFNGPNRFLSNFYPSSIDFEGLVYPTVEHAYQAAKTTDEAMRKVIQGQPTPGGAKQGGRNLALREDWDDVKLMIMRTLLRKKFYDPVLSAALIQTGTKELVELNYWHDQFWGHCDCNKHKDGENLNWLGKLLMETRDEIQGTQRSRPSEAMAQTGQ